MFLILLEHCLPPTDLSGCFQPEWVHLIPLSVAIAFVLRDVERERE